MVEIYRGNKACVSKAMNFIKENWKETHILSWSRELFEWQYSRNDKFYFYLAEDETGKICGFHGFVAYNEEQYPDVAGTMWKVIKSDNPMLGIDMLNYARNDLQYRSNCCLGLNQRARKIETLMGGKVHQLKHYYRLNNLAEYVIADVKKKNIKQYIFSDCKLIEMNNFNEFKNNISVEMLTTKIPYKDLEYYKHRYFEHPIYEYNIYNIKNTTSFIVMRFIKEHNSKMIKMVDFIGEDEELRGIGAELDRIMSEQQCEYIEFYCLGIENDILFDAGFTLMNDEDNNIIPHYFEPFERRNVEIFTSDIPFEHYYMFIGNGDQDRPSILI